MYFPHCESVTFMLLILLQGTAKKALGKDNNVTKEFYVLTFWKQQPLHLPKVDVEI